MLVIALAAIAGGCGQPSAGLAPSASTVPSTAAVSPAAASFGGMWQNSQGQVLFVDRAGTGYVGTFYDGGVKQFRIGLHEGPGGLVGPGSSADHWEVSFGTGGRLVLGNGAAPLSFTRASAGASGLVDTSGAKSDSFAGTWRTLGQPSLSKSVVVIACAGNGYRVSMGFEGGPFSSHLFYRDGDHIQDFRPGTPKPKDLIRAAFNFEGHPGQVVMDYGNGLPHLLVRTSMSTALPTPSPTP